VAHEHSDVNVRAILAFIVGLVVVAAVIHVGVWLLFDVFERRTAAADPRPAPLAKPTNWATVNPPVQTRPGDALKSLRAEEETRLTTEGPVDGQPGVYRIPIERAKQLVVERGLPTRTAQ
jgi:hypothetical protein